MGLYPLVLCRQSAGSGMFRKEIPSYCLEHILYIIKMKFIVKVIMPSRNLLTNPPLLTISMAIAFMHVHVYLLAIFYVRPSQ